MNGQAERTHPLRRIWLALLGTDVDGAAGWLRPRPTRAQLRTDVVVALIIGGLMVASSLAYATMDIAGQLGQTFAPWVPVVTPLLYTAALAVRRALPIPALLVGTVAFVLGLSLSYHEYLVTQVAYFLVMYTAGAWSRHRVLVTWTRVLICIGMIAWVVVIACGSLVAASSTPELTDDDRAHITTAVVTLAFNLGINFAYFSAATWFGSSEYRRAAQRAVLEERSASLAEHAAALEAERRIVADQAVRLDRLEIARELHDVVAHHVSIMGLQASVARRALERASTMDAGSAASSAEARVGASAASVETALEQTRAIEQSARSAIDELHTMLSTLRRGGADTGDAARAGGDGDVDGDALVAPPTEGLEAVASSTATIDRLPELIEESREAGLRVSWHVFGQVGEVSSTAQLAIYRTLQESLTNVRKHAGATAAVDVRLRYLDDAVELEVADDGWRSATPAVAPMPSPALSTGRAGRGIQGMRERALAVGGSLEAAPRAAGGFVARIRVPSSRMPEGCPEADAPDGAGVHGAARSADEPAEDAVRSGADGSSDGVRTVRAAGAGDSADRASSADRAAAGSAAAFAPPALPAPPTGLPARADPDPDPDERRTGEAEPVDAARPIGAARAAAADPA